MCTYLKQDVLLQRICVNMCAQILALEEHRKGKIDWADRLPFLQTIARYFVTWKLVMLSDLCQEVSVCYSLVKRFRRALRENIWWYILPPLCGITSAASKLSQQSCASLLGRCLLRHCQCWWCCRVRDLCVLSDYCICHQTIWAIATCRQNPALVVSCYRSRRNSAFLCPVRETDQRAM